MAHLDEWSCSLGSLYVLLIICLCIILVISHFGFEGKNLILIAAVPEHCQAFIFHYANTPMQYTAIFHGCKNVNFQMKFFKYFSYFCLKH